MVLVLEVDKSISNIQRSILVYGTTGSASVLSNIKKEASELKSKLDSVLKTTKKQSSILLLRNMIKIEQEYSENINNLQKRYDYRNNIIENQLPAVTDAGKEYLKDLISKSQRAGKVQTVKIAQMALLNWLDAERNAYLFIQKRKYQFKIYSKKHIEKAMLLNKHLIKTNVSNTKFKNLIETFSLTFEQSVQANRIYLSLVNVVMAGASSEFETLSNQLKKDTLETLNNVSAQSLNNYNKELKITIIFIVILIILLITLALFYNHNIAFAVKKISDVFNSFQEGDFNPEVPGTSRDDEIGQLAKAANAFKVVSHQMQEAKEQAEKSAKSKNDFLANMSHEIRTPMNGVIGMLSLLDQTNLDIEQKDMLKTIESSSTSLLSLLNDILDSSKIDAGNIELEHKQFDLHECINDVYNLFENVAQTKKIALKMNYDTETIPKYIVGDITRLKQIVSNLISNAIKFTNHGQVELDVTKLEEKSDQTLLIQFSVKDTGIGIAKNSIEKLFQAFSQADASITRKYGGTGLGLSISAKLAKVMNGEIKVRSEEGKGSVFNFIVPLKSSDQCLSQKKTEQDINIVNTNYKILLAEDNLINQKVIKMILKKLNLSCDLAVNGQEAVDLAKENKYDMIFMDMQMPVLDGLSATKLIRQNNDLHQPFIIAITANAFSSDRKECLDAGMNHFLPKPISIRAIKELIINFSNA
jgi:signal transduction histidine kinase/CheY-like chemotaxis protein